MALWFWRIVIVCVTVNGCRVLMFTTYFRLEAATQTFFFFRGERAGCLHSASVQLLLMIYFERRCCFQKNFTKPRNNCVTWESNAASTPWLETVMTKTEAKTRTYRVAGSFSRKHQKWIYQVLKMSFFHSGFLWFLEKLCFNKFEINCFETVDFPLFVHWAASTISFKFFCFHGWSTMHDDKKVEQLAGRLIQRLTSSFAA